MANVEGVRIEAPRRDDEAPQASRSSAVGVTIEALKMPRA